MAAYPSTLLPLGGRSRYSGPDVGHVDPSAGFFGLGKNNSAMLAYLKNLYKPAMNQPGLAPLTPGQIKSRAAGYVSSSVDPIMAADRASSARMTAGGVGSIRGGTANYADAVRPIAGQVADIGTRQAAEDTAETGALASFLRDSGAGTFGDVGSKLQAAGIDAPVGANMGAGAGGIAAAVGLASARDATAEGANNARYAALLPGFANLAGQNAENSFRADQQGALADRLATLQGTVPGLTSQVVNDLTSNETAKAGARSSAAGDRAGALATFLGNSVDDATTLRIANDSNVVKALGAAASAAAPSSALSGKYKYIVDHNGNPVLDASGHKQPSAGWHTDPKTGAIVHDVSPSTKNSTAQAAIKAKRSALKSADSIARSIISSHLKAASKKSSASAGPFGGATTVGKPTVGSPAYNEAVNAAVASLGATLGPFLSHDEIVKFVQERALVSGWAPAAKPKLGPPAPGQSAPGPLG